MLPELLDQIPPDQDIASVTADGACDTRKCHDAIAARSAAAIIPVRKNAKPWKKTTAGAAARNEILRTTKHLGRTIWRRWSDYLAEISRHVATAAHALLILDGAGWHNSKSLVVPDNITLMPLPP